MTEKSNKLLQVRIPADIMEILDTKIIASGRTRAGWLRELLEKECDRIAPHYEIINLDFNKTVKTGRAEVLKYRAPSNRPLEIAIENDERSDQGWNMNPGNHKIRIKETLYDIKYTLFDMTTKRVVAVIEERK
jgi:hypothetical protein